MDILIYIRPKKQLYPDNFTPHRFSLNQFHRLYIILGISEKFIIKIYLKYGFLRQDNRKIASIMIPDEISMSYFIKNIIH